MCRCFERTVNRLTDTRIEEKAHQRSKWVREWHCTWSSVPFLAIAWLRLHFDASVAGRARALYHLMFWIGGCSMFHHATRKDSVTVPIDWAPISITVLMCVHWDVALVANPATVALCVGSFAWLIWDQLKAPIPSPWGHVIWHITSAITLDSLYQSYIAARLSAP